MEQLLVFVNVTDSFGTIANLYPPQGQIDKVDVFFCMPLHSVEKDWEISVKGQLSRWQDFSRMRVEFQECHGDDAITLNPTYVEGFERRLNTVSSASGI